MATRDKRVSAGSDAAKRPAQAGTTGQLRRRIKFALYEALRLTVSLLLRLLVGFRVTGAYNVPTRGPVLIVANHLHNLDLIVLSAAVPRPILYMAKRELFAHPAFAWLIRNFGAFPVNRDAPDRAALRQALTLLNEGLVVGILPEGTRSRSATLQPGHPGAALVALQSGAPIVPVGITGTEHLPLDAKARREPWFGRARVRVTIGQPFTLPPRRPGEKTDLPAVTDRIMREIAALLPPAYRGVYAETVPAGDQPTAG